MASNGNQHKARGAAPDFWTVGIAVLLIVIAFIVISRSWAADLTPLLTNSRPNLEFPLFLAGAITGSCVAYALVTLPGIRGRKRRWAFWVFFPFLFAGAMIGAGDLLYEAISFRGRIGTPERVELRVIEKELDHARRSRRIYYRARIRSPFDERIVTFNIDQSLFERLQPQRDCLPVTIEKATNGAVRVRERLSPGRGPLTCST